MPPPTSDRPDRLTPQFVDAAASQALVGAGSRTSTSMPMVGNRIEMRSLGNTTGSNRRVRQRPFFIAGDWHRLPRLVRASRLLKLALCATVSDFQSPRQCLWRRQALSRGRRSLRQRSRDPNPKLNPDRMHGGLLSSGTVKNCQRVPRIASRACARTGGETPNRRRPWPDCVQTGS